MKQKKAWRIVKEVIGEADIVVEVVDARDPIGTRNRKLERMVIESGKKLLIVMNKADLVPKEWAEEYKKRSEIPVIFISARERKGTGILRKELKKMAKTIDKDKVKVALIGYPNVGKSTIINVLKGKHAVGTAPIPGYTKGKHLIRLTKRLWLLDTPGVVPIDDFDELVIKGGFPADKIEEPVKPALKLIRRILETRKEALTEKFDIREFRDEEDILRKIGERRGIIREGGEVDIEETARWFLREWQTGRFTLFSNDEEKKEEYIESFGEILEVIKQENLTEPRIILWKFRDLLEEYVGSEKRFGAIEVGDFTVAIATGFKKCPNAIKFIERITGKNVITSECFGKKWKGVVAILD
ncbi:GTPase [Pyrococcus abyssi]|uniref:GTP-binding protein n=1 Tax=Pyrococcus abyssi (strain GE5 / Orsay) TaxID=272844 RepID=Q9UYW3_PYRAB|nr:GTPase [Pyrococcus abyssi]CAB50299.1 GTP-binding protein homolog [Pyrococcus abyssi GE5]CCE70837.1 TPA: GTP-binding protein [Pyrococcus abyssi GE5]